MNEDPVDIAIFASGSGTNAERIMDFFKNRADIRVALLLSNNPKAFVLKRAEKFSIPTFVFDREGFYHSGKIIQELQQRGIDWLILAGFLWLVPANLLDVYKGKIVNIHPALLPKYGGKGMYGMKVHEAVINACDQYSGISIHFVNEQFDEGQIVFQASCSIEEGETPETLAEKIHLLEYRYFPEVIEKLIKENKKDE